MKVHKFTQMLAARDAVLVSVERTEGSVPREAGAWMGVFSDELVGTVGGGQLEFQAIAQARQMLAGEGVHAGGVELRFALGPSLGQCCGGVMHLRLQRVGAADIPALQGRLAQRQSPLALFGGGHVGRALVQVLSGLPFDISWIDSRDEIFPGDVPPGVRCEHSDPVHAAVGDLAAQSSVLIMSFSHAEDLDIVAACLRRQRQQADLRFIGLIGSRTKWAAFRHRLEERGFTAGELERVTCPIGLPGLSGKDPAVIAVSVAAQLLLQP